LWGEEFCIQDVACRIDVEIASAYKTGLAITFFWLLSPQSGRGKPPKKAGRGRLRRNDDPLQCKGLTTPPTGGGAKR